MARTRLYLHKLDDPYLEIACHETENLALSGPDQDSAENLAKVLIV